MANNPGPHLATKAGPYPCLLLHTNNRMTEDNLAECEPEGNIRYLRIRPRSRGFSYFGCVIHEWLHALDYDWEEDLIGKKYEPELREKVWRCKTYRWTVTVIRRWMKINCPQYSRYAPQLAKLLWEPEVRRRAGLLQET